MDERGPESNTKSLWCCEQHADITGVNNIDTLDHSTQQVKITDDLEALLCVLPPYIKNKLEEVDQGEKLIEIIMAM